MSSRLPGSDLEQLNIWPAEVMQPDLDLYFLLSADDKTFIGTYRTAKNQLGVALQLCSLRYLGFFADVSSNPPDPVAAHVAAQLELPVEPLTNYGQRDKTRTQHQQRVLVYLGYRRAAPVDLLTLEHWLRDRALEHDQPKLLLEVSCDYLRRAKIVRPGVSVLSRMVSAARAEAEALAYERLQPLLGSDLRRELDELASSETIGRSRLSWLQRTPVSNKTSAIVQTLDKLAYLHELGVADWDVSILNPNRLKWLAKRGSRLKPHRVGRLKPEVRLPMLVAFLHEALYTFTDAVVEMVDQRLWELHIESKRAFQNDRLAATNTINDTLGVLKVLAELYLQDSVGVAAPGGGTQPPSRERVEFAVSQADHLIRPEQDAYVDYFSKRYRKVQNFSRRLLDVMRYESSGPDGGLLKALDLVREIHAGTRRKLPPNAPTAFVPDVWQAEVMTEEGVNWRSYEIAALWILRQRLRSGDVYTPHSRRHRELERYLIPKLDWPQHRTDVLGLTGTPLSADTRLEARFKILQRLAVTVDSQLREGASDLRTEEARLVLSPLEEEKTSPELRRLRRLVESRLPPADITDVLIEVDNLSSFSSGITHLDGAPRHGRETLTYLYACLLAQACNLGFKQMAVSTDLNYERLLWCNRWYLREDTLNEAVTTLVNYHHSLPFSSVWGGGVLSSSDGQRFPVSGDTRRARALPRYFGYGKGVTAYTWTSDQFSQ